MCAQLKKNEQFMKRESCVVLGSKNLTLMTGTMVRLRDVAGAERHETSRRFEPSFDKLGVLISQMRVHVR